MITGQETQSIVAELDSLLANKDLATRDPRTFMILAINLIKTLPGKDRTRHVDRVFTMDAVKTYAIRQTSNFLFQAADLIKTLSNKDRAKYVDRVFAMDAVRAYQKQHNAIHEAGNLIETLPEGRRAQRWAKILKIPEIVNLASRNPWAIISPTAFYIQTIPTSAQARYVKNVLAMQGVKATAKKAPDEFIKGVAHVIQAEGFPKEGRGAWLAPVFAVQGVKDYAKKNREAFIDCVREFMRFIPREQIKESPTTVLYDPDLRGSLCGSPLSAHKDILPGELIFCFGWHTGPIDRLNDYIASERNHKQIRHILSGRFREVARLKKKEGAPDTRAQLLQAAWIIDRGRAHKPALTPALGAA